MTALAISVENLASAVRRQRHGGTFKFLWSGVNRESQEFRHIEHDIEKLGLREDVEFIERTDNPTRYLQALDIFALTSREDPFPVAMSEAANASLPIVYFIGSGGAEEFVGSDCGIGVDFMGIDAFAQAIILLAESPELRKSAGRCARSRVEHLSINTQGPKILHVINSQMRR